MTATITAAEIAAALTATDGNATRTALILNVSRRTLGRLIDQHRDAIDAITAQAQSGEPEPEVEVEVEVETATVAADGGLTVIAQTRHVDIAPQDDEPATRVRTWTKPAQDTGPAQPVKDAPAGFPEGVITPTAFRHHLVREGLAPESLSIQRVYNWVASKSFPRADVDTDSGSRPGVPVTEALAWYAARQARAAAKNA